ncbi:haloacid dehalogenase-like hydrolase [Candidatus Woesearchaeota archaeon]|nr:haloacid dehalogenase-like hydrolase [Candidatus Woesearchaeota archaeon]
MPQNIIALLYDFDSTLSPECMQEALFKKYNVDGNTFWAEKRGLMKNAEGKGVNYDTECAYMNLILRYIREEKFPPLSNLELRELGKEVALYPGLPDFLPNIKEKTEEKYDAEGITLEHYVISTGLTEMIKGSAVGEYLEEIFASEYNTDGNGVICEIARAVGHTKKTEFLHLINKGGNKDPSIDVNGILPRELRRIPFENMVYIGDGPTDVPCFATLNHRGGISIGVYNPSSEDAFRKAYQLREQKRVFSFGEADYREGSHTYRTILHAVTGIAERIIGEQDETQRKGRREGPRL